jgi:hypothetical protein
MYPVPFREAALKLYNYFGSMRQVAGALDISRVANWAYQTGKSI